MTDSHHDFRENSDAYLEQCITIDDVAISEEFMRLPSDYHYWSQKYAEAKQSNRLAKAEVDRTRSHLSISLREEITNERGKCTESMLTAAIEIDAEYVARRNAEILSETEVLRLAGVIEALKTKREMLISLGAHARAEMKTI